MSSSVWPKGVLRFQGYITHCILSLWYVSILFTYQASAESVCSTGQGNPLFFKDPDFIAVAENHKATVAQVAVSWAVQRGTVPIPKSANVERMKANITVRCCAECFSIFCSNVIVPIAHQAYTGRDADDQ